MKNKRQIAEHLVKRLFGRADQWLEPVKIHLYCESDTGKVMTDVFSAEELEDWIFHDLNTLPPEMEGDQ